MYARYMVQENQDLDNIPSEKQLADIYDPKNIGQYFLDFGVDGKIDLAKPILVIPDKDLSLQQKIKIEILPDGTQIIHARTSNSEELFDGNVMKNFCMGMGETYGSSRPEYIKSRNAVGYKFKEYLSLSSKNGTTGRFSPRT
jgi:hypothetical protein